jgi:hypothetical protein
MQTRIIEMKALHPKSGVLAPALEVVSKPRITPEDKAQADSKAQHTRQYVSISKGRQRRHRASDGVLKPLLAFLLMSCAVSCSGSNSAGGGIDGSGFVSQGAVSAIGSIVVNGTEFDTNNAAIIIKGVGIGVGDAAVVANLDIGRVVTVQGRRSGDPNQVIADRVVYSDNVEGPVESIRDMDAVTREIVVMGQRVIANVVTRFKATTFDTIAPNDVVEVSGLFDDTGAIWATFIGKVGVFNLGLEVEVKGYVVDLNAGLKTFAVNGLTVDYSSADTSSLPGGIPADGLRVEVQGTLDDAGSELTAAKIQLDDDLGAGDANEIEVTGFVTDFVSLSEFTVGNQVVQADAETLFIDGTRANVALGVKLEVSGTLVNGVLLATEIEFWTPDQIEVEDVVTQIASLSEFTVGNQLVRTDANTVFEGGVPGDIALGVRLEVKGVPVDIVRSVLVADKVSFEEE